MELKVGHKATRSSTLTFDNVKTYAEITGDYNPLHFDGASTATPAMSPAIFAPAPSFDLPMDSPVDVSLGQS